MNRRGFLKRCGILMGGILVATSVADNLKPLYATAHPSKNGTKILGNNDVIICSKNMESAARELSHSAAKTKEKMAVNVFNNTFGGF